MSPAELKALIASRGWSMANLAWRWQISPEHMSRLIADRDRPTHWEDAARGVPIIDRLEARRIDKVRLAAVSEKLQAREARKLQALADQGIVNTQSGYAYQGYLIRGSVVGVIREIRVADIGQEGVVAEVEDTGKGERYRIVFPRGDEWFDANAVAAYLVETGKERAI